MTGPAPLLVPNGRKPAAHMLTLGPQTQHVASGESLRPFQPLAARDTPEAAERTDMQETMLVRNRLTPSCFRNAGLR